MTPAGTRNVFRSVVRALIFVACASPILSVHAQKYQPNCTNESIYTSLEGRGLYIHGGQDVPGYMTDEFFMIDLSKSWNVDNPTYKKLRRSLASDYNPGGITSDGKLWTGLTEHYAMRYNAKTKAWLELVPTNITDPTGLTGATDHTTNTMYVPFGYPNAKGHSEMLIVNLRTGDITSDGRSYPMNQQTGYATAWNPHRKSLIYVSSDGVFEYTQKDGWKPFFSKGLGVPPVWGSCLVSVGGGTKMALFGGLTKDDAMIGDIYVLDLTMEGKERWTKASVTSKQRSEMARQAPACGSTGNQVIISGGSVLPGWNDFECPKQRTLVFDVKTMKWTNRYVAQGQK